MNREEKFNFIKIHSSRKVEFSLSEWNNIKKEYHIGYNDIMKNINSKYQYINKDNKVRSFVYTISNGNAFDCPALCSGRCNMDCYGLKHTFTWDTTKINKEFQRIVLNYMPLSELFSCIKYHATCSRKNQGNLLKVLRINEVSDLTNELFNRLLALCDMLYSDKETKHIKVFSYSKMDLNWNEVQKRKNLTINASQTINPLYRGGNTYIAVDKEFYDNIVETDVIKKCNCETNCHNCELCYSDNRLIIFCLIH